ncbi:MAG: MarC family protein, partial [Tepidiformaceae bacterium]
MNSYLQLLVFFFAAMNPAAATVAMMKSAGPEVGRARQQVVAAGVTIAAVLYAGATFGAEQFLNALEIEAESFRVAAGIVMAASGVFIILRGAPEVESAGMGVRGALFPLAVPLLFSPAGVVAAISYGADDGAWKAFLALAVSLALAGVLLAWQARIGRP